MAGVNRIRIRDGFLLRHFGKQYNVKKVGLYLDHRSWPSGEKVYISPSEAIQLRDWLSRYIAQQILKTVPANIPEMKTKTRSVLRGLEKLEGES